MICKYCDRQFCSISNLNRHIKRSLSCSRLSDLFMKYNSLKNELVSVRHEYDDKLSSLKRQHEDEIDDLQYELATKDERIEKLENENHQLNMELVAKKAEKSILQNLIGKTGNTTNTNNTTHNHLHQMLVVLDMSPDRLQDIFDRHYTRQHLIGGSSGLGIFVAEHIAITEEGENTYGISDFNRGTGTFIDPVNGVTKDGKCLKLMNMIYDPCLRRADRIIEDENIHIETRPGGNGDIWVNMESRGYNELKHLMSNNKSFIDELVRRTIHV